MNTLVSAASRAWPSISASYTWLLATFAWGIFTVKSGFCCSWVASGADCHEPKLFSTLQETLIMQRVSTRNAFLLCSLVCRSCPAHSLPLFPRTCIVFLRTAQGRKDAWDCSTLRYNIATLIFRLRHSNKQWQFLHDKYKVTSITRRSTCRFLSGKRRGGPKEVVHCHTPTGEIWFAGILHKHPKCNYVSTVEMNYVSRALNYITFSSTPSSTPINGQKCQMNQRCGRQSSS